MALDYYQYPVILVLEFFDILRKLLDVCCEQSKSGESSHSLVDSGSRLQFGSLSNVEHFFPVP